MRNRKKKSIGIFSKTILAFNFVAAFFLLLCYLASFVNPDTFWPLAFIGLSYPFVLLINLCFFIYWILRKPVFSLLSALTILIGWKFLTGTIGFRETTGIEVPKSSESFVRVMTWNAHYFRKFDDQGHEKAVKDQMLEVIQNEQPDIICIQEFYSRRKGEFNLQKAMTKLLNSSHYYIEENYGNDYEMHAMAIFSKYPIRNKGIILFPQADRGNEAQFADFRIKDKRFRVYNIHLESIKFQPEDYEYLKSVKEINTDVKSSRRIGSRLKHAFIKRGQQVELLKEHASKLNIPYIIAGDFNDTPISYAVNNLSDGMHNSFREKGSGFGITYNGAFPNFQIDYILVSPGISVKNYIIIKKKLSDHYPVRCDIEIDSNAVKD